jgi:SAM-dependent methyltransferase
MTQTPAGEYALRPSEAEVERYALMARAARESETDLWAAAGILPGASVADVGCGPGALFPALVDAVGPAGRVTAVDGDPAAVGQARALVEANGWPNVSVQVGRADATGLPAGAFDVVMMRHVLAHNGPGEQAIVDHLAGLVRPGGSVYLVDVFGDAIAVVPSDPEVEELDNAYRRFHAARGNDLRTGLRLDALLTRAGLEVVAYRGWFNIVRPQGSVRPPSWAAREAMVAAGIAGPADVERWGAALDRLVPQRPTVFASVFGAIGRRPG